MTKRFIPSYENGPVCLRLLTVEDLELTLLWRNQEHIRRWFFHSGIIAKDQHENWFCQYEERDDDFVFIIEEIGNNNRPIGQVALYHIEWEIKRAEFGRLMIGEVSVAGKGFAQAATEAVLHIGFDFLGLNEVYLEVYSDNLRAIRVYEKTGFRIIETKDNITVMTIKPSRRLTEE